MECSAGLVFFMQEVMRLKKTSQTTDLVLALFLYIPVVWAALLIAQSLGGGLPELLSNLTAALEQPFQIQWTDKSLLSILVCTGAYLMGLCLYASGQGRTRDGEEHGSAAWGSPRQLNAQFRQKQNKILGWIKTTKEKKQDRRWQLADMRREKEEAERIAQQTEEP